MVNSLDMMYLNAISILSMAKKRIRKRVHDFWVEEKGSASTIVIEIVMVGMILVLGFIFRKQIGNLFASLWNSLIQFGDKAEDPSIESMPNPFG